MRTHKAKRLRRGNGKREARGELIAALEKLERELIAGGASQAFDGVQHLVEVGVEHAPVAFAEPVIEYGLRHRALSLL